MQKPKAMKDELLFPNDELIYEEYIDKLLHKVKTIGELDSDELGELECCDKVEYAEFLNEDDLNIDNKMKLVLTTGEEIEFELV